MVRNAELKARFRALADEVTQVLPDVVADEGTRGQLGKLDQGMLPSRWGRVLVQQVRHTLFEEIRGQLEVLPTRQTLLDFAVNDATVRVYALRGTLYQDWDESSPFVREFYNSQLDGQVRFTIRRRLVYPFLKRVTSLLFETGLQPLPLEEFDHLYAGIEAEGYDDKTIYRLLALLYGVAFARLPVDLGDGISICQMTEREHSIWMGAEDFYGVTARGFAQLGLGAAIRIDVLQSLRTQMPGELMLLDDQRWLEPLRHVLQALRLFKGGDMVSPGVAHGWLDSWRGDNWSMQPVEMFRVSPGDRGLRFEEEECRRLPAFWQSFADRTPNTAGSDRLQIALRRYDRAVLSGNPSDRLIDCCIAFDALFAPNDTLELTYRVCLRLAFLIGRDVAKREEVFNVSKAAYNARGGIVHGSKSAAAVFREATKGDLPADTGKVVDGPALLRGTEFIERKVLPLLRLALLKHLSGSINENDLEKNVFEAGERLKDLGSEAPWQASRAENSPA